MSQYFEVHPDNPQLRLLKQAAQILDGGGIAAIPTDSSYAFEMADEVLQQIGRAHV